jgi:hypothetical protein
MNSKLIGMFLVCALFGGTAVSQMNPAAMMKDGGSLPIGLGATFIDGETFYLFNISPELSFGKIGLGLDLNLRMSQSGKLRSGEYETFSDYLHILRYVRYGAKGEPFYARVGRLDFAMLGHGSIVYLYRNSASYDLRRTGLELDVNFEKVGVEMVYSDVTGKGILGLRASSKPLKFTSLATIPVINNFEMGVTFATDLHGDANKIYGGSDLLSASADKGSLSIYGVDLGLPIVKYSMFSSDLYLDYAKIAGYGSGLSAGINLKLSGLGLVTLDAKYERRFSGDKFLPAYFNALYEKDRFAIHDTVHFISKAQTLQGITKSEGYYGEAVLSILGFFKIIAGYQSPVGVSNQGLLHMETDVPAIPGIVFRAAYDKKNVGELFTFDDNVLMTAEIGYKPMPFLLVSTVYQRTFAPEKDAGGNTIGFKKQDRIEPKVSIVFNF